MKTAHYEILAASPVVQQQLAAFHEVTGLWVELEPPDAQAVTTLLAPHGNPLCRLLAGSQLCRHTDRILKRLMHHKLVPHSMHCFAGLICLVTPILVDGQHVATLHAGGVLQDQPTRHRFARLQMMLKRTHVPFASVQLERAYFSIPVIAANKLRAIRTLLRVLVHELGTTPLEQFSEPCAASLPYRLVWLQKVEKYVQTHCENALSTRDLAQFTHVSPQHFCRKFRQLTGHCFLDELTHVRIARAKLLLADCRRLVKQVAAQTGFRSIAHFNHVFRNVTGQTPTQYRTTMPRPH